MEPKTCIGPTGDWNVVSLGRSQLIVVTLLFPFTVGPLLGDPYLKQAARTAADAYTVQTQYLRPT